LLAFLALHRHPLMRVYVAGTLWIDSSERHANACLRTTLWRLRQPPDRRLVVASFSHVALAPEVSVDVTELYAVARRVLNTSVGVLRVLHRLRTAGDVLPDSYEDWVIIERERFRQVRLHALEALSDALLAAGAHYGAIEAGLAAVEAEPLRESAHRAVIRAHLAEGNRSDAIRQYRIYRRSLADQLGLEPSEAMQALVASLPVGDAAVTHHR